MANPFKQLAGETAVYGLSTILARIINFVLVPVYTRVLAQADYGVFSEFMGWVGVFQIVLVLGLETGCFRFASEAGKTQEDIHRIFGNAFLAVFGVSAMTLALVLVFSNDIASAMGYAGFGCMIRQIGILMALDAVTAILFARLRNEHRPWNFAIVKTLKIFTELGCNLWLFLGPAKPLWIYNFISLTPDYTYPIFSVFVSCIVCTILLLPEFFRLSLRLDRKLLKDMLIYSLPLMVAALPGTLNDLLDRILFRWFDTSSTEWRATLGVYQAAVKLSVIMNLFIQMFRYASEPFFFQKAKDRNSKELYARVMNWFVAFCCAILLGVVYYIDVLGLLLGKNFRCALGVVPVMLLSYMILGMLFNVNMWYKISKNTGKAIWVTLAGLVITVVVNVVFMPRFSFWASAFGHLLSYSTMLLISVLWGRKYYNIPYNWDRIGIMFLMCAAFYGLSFVTGNISSLVPRLAAGTVAVLAFCGLCFFYLRKMELKYDAVKEA